MDNKSLVQNIWQKQVSLYVYYLQFKINATKIKKIRNLKRILLSAEFKINVNSHNEPMGSWKKCISKLCKIYTLHTNGDKL